MECTGRIKDASRGLDGKVQITLTINESAVALAGYDSLKGLENLDIKIKKHRDKRSSDANAYLWCLLSKMADVLQCDKWNVYIQMLRQYGVFTHLIVKPNVVERVKSEWRAVEELGEVNVNGMFGIQLQCYFGSSTYDTKEMSVLIDGVVREAKDMGIETLQPHEIERMKAEWNQ